MRVFRDTAQRFLQVVTGHVGEGVEFLVAARKVGIEFAQPVRACDDQLHDEQPQPQCRVDLARLPRHRALTHGFGDTLERCSRREPLAVRAGDGRLVARVATPFHRLNRLGPEPHDDVPFSPRQRQRQHAARDRRIVRRAGKLAHQRIGRIHGLRRIVKLGPRVEPRLQRIELRLLRRRAHAPPAVAVIHRGAGRIHGIEQIRRADGHRREIKVQRRLRDDAVVDFLEPQAVVQRLAVHRRAQLQRGDLREEFAARAHLIREARGRVVMARDEPPQLAID